MQIIRKTIAELTRQNLCHFFVHDDVDFDSSLSGSLKRTIEAILLVE